MWPSTKQCLVPAPATCHLIQAEGQAAAGVEGYPAPLKGLGYLYRHAGPGFEIGFPPLNK